MKQRRGWDKNHYICEIDVSKIMMTFTLVGQMLSGKNNMRVDPRTGRHYPTPRFAAWRDRIVGQLLQQRGEWSLLKRRVKFSVEYVPGDKRKRDMAGMLDALCHCLERAKIVRDDSQLDRCLGWITHRIDKDNPRLNITLEEYDDP